MNGRRRNKEGFLGTYKLEQDYLQKPDKVHGRPGMFSGVSADGTRVIVKEWLLTGKANTDDLEHIWRHELRQLHRLAGYPGAADCIAHLHEAGSDSKGFYLVIAPGQRQPLQSLLDTFGSEHWLKQPRVPGNRGRIWSNLKILCFGLEALHSQGLLHRSLDAWAVLTSGSVEPDFQLTGFEWSMRITNTETAINRKRINNVSDSFDQDWLMFALLAADLLGVDKKKLANPSVAPHEVSEYLSIEETKLLRSIMQMIPMAPLNGETVSDRIEGVQRLLSATIASRKSKLHLVVRLGSNTSLGKKIREASRFEIESDDIQGQHDFIINDICDGALLIAVKQKDSEDMRMVLRGKNLIYRLQEFRSYKSGSVASWEFAYCERVDELAPAPVNVIGTRTLEPATLEVLLMSDATERYSRMRGKLLSWGDLKAGFENFNLPLTSEQVAHRALTLLQLLEALHAAAEVFAVEILEVPEELRGDFVDESQYLCVKLRPDAEWESFAKVLGLKSPTERYLKSLESEGLSAEGWILADGRSLGGRGLSDTEWHFEKNVKKVGRQDLYLFKGQVPAPILRDPVIYVASIGREVQFKRRLKSLKALKDHQELLRMLVDPRQRVVDSHDKFIEDETFESLDLPKQEALRQLTSTLPLFLVQGPPGVGKTRLVRDLVKRRFYDEPTSRLLLTAQSNAAIDHLMDELEGLLLREGTDAPLVVRSSKRDSISAPSYFDIRVQSQRLVKKLSESALFKEIPSRLQTSLANMVTLDKGRSSSGPPTHTVGGRAVEQAHRAFEGLVARAANVVFATTNSGELERLIDERGQFDWVIIEEAAKATGSELISPMLLSHRRLMIGDHRQLPAFASDQLKKLLSQPMKVNEAITMGEDFISKALRDETTEELLDEVAEDENRLPALCAEALRLLTYFESTIEAEYARQDKKRGGRPIAKKLTSQHRMHPKIASLVSRCFYGDLDTDEACKRRFELGEMPFYSTAECISSTAAIVVIDMPYVQSNVNLKNGDMPPSWHNPTEVHAVVKVLESIRVMPGKKASLTVLSPYEQQRQKIEAAIAENKDESLSHISAFQAPSHNGRICHTVDSFQGSEADIVVISLVRNNHHSAVNKALGFLSDPRRMNVLLSRAKWQMVLITSIDFLTEIVSAAKGSESEVKVDFLKRMLDYLSEEVSDGSVVKVAYEDLKGVQV